MPFTVTAPHGVLTASGKQRILPLLTQAVLELNGAVGNSFFTAMVGGHVAEVDAADVYAGGVNRPVVVVKFEVPNIGLSTVELRAAFIAAAVKIVQECTVPWHEPANTWVNIFNAPDGGWSVDGRSFSGDELVAAITAAAQR